MITPQKIKREVSATVRTIKFSQAEFQDGYWKLSLHLKINSKSDEIEVKRINFNRYLGLVGSAENPFGDPFVIKQKHDRKKALKEFLTEGGIGLGIGIIAGLMVIKFIGV